MSVLSIQNVVKRFGEQFAVDRVSLEVGEGEIFGLLGPNGAGKSTTIHMVMGLLSPEQGSISVLGKDTQKQALQTKAMIGYVPQDLAIYEDLTSVENVKFFAGLYGLRGKKLNDAAMEALEFTGLAEKAKEQPKKFSGGMKRRLNIACAIAHKPKLIIMDEPTVGIDPQSRNHILESVKTLNKSGCTVLYTSHYMEEVEEICGRIAIVDHGKVIAQGNVAELKNLVTDRNVIAIELAQEGGDIGLDRLRNLPGVREAEHDGNFVRIASDLAVRNIDLIVKHLAEFKAQIKGIESKTPDLESVFLSLTGRSLRE